MAASHCVLLAFLSVVLLVVEADVVPDEPETRIYGGKEIEYSEAPWMAFIYMPHLVNENFHKVCGGSVIHQDWVLTAAHCTIEHTADLINMRIGSKLLNDGGEVYGVAEVVNHEKYGNKRNDISLLKTIKHIKLGNLVRPIKLPAAGSRPLVGKKLTVTGWGIKEDGQHSDNLRAVDINVRPFKECPYESAHEETQICAGLSGKSSCPGDSGGPLVDGDVIVGIVSYGYDGKCAIFPAAYTNVGTYVSWIRQHVKV